MIYYIITASCGYDTHHIVGIYATFAETLIAAEKYAKCNESMPYIFLEKIKIYKTYLRGELEESSKPKYSVEGKFWYVDDYTTKPYGKIKIDSF